MAKTKTMAKLQARARKTSRKTATAARGKPQARSQERLKARPQERPQERPKPRSKAGRKQTFNVSHFQAEAFRTDGLRSYARYRDLGMSKATNGLLQAHVIRLVPPCDPAVVSKRHFHDVDVQMIYVLKGWIRTEFEGHGEVTMREGTAWLQPPRIKHTVLDYSDDCELLEIILPAEFKTVELE
jgi:uncharacterized RmlC-like cupin family protein